MSFNNPFEQFFNKKEEETIDDASVVDRSESEPTFPVGEYTVKATFVNQRGEQITRKMDFPLRFSTPPTQKEIEKKATGEVSFLGLHNFGMDIYVERYPNGHPVKIEVFDKDDNSVVNYTQVFNASGHPVF